MVSNIMFTQIHTRLYEIFGHSNNSFGNQNLLLLGDLLQVFTFNIVLFKDNRISLLSYHLLKNDLFLNKYH